MQSLVWYAGRAGQLKLSQYRHCLGLAGLLRNYATSNTKTPKAKGGFAKNEVKITSKALSPKVASLKAASPKAASPKAASPKATQKSNTNQPNTKKDDKTNKKVTPTAKKPDTKTKVTTKAVPYKPIDSKKTTPAKKVNVEPPKSKSPKLAPQVGDIESKGKKIVRPTEAVKGTKITETDTRGALVKDKPVSSTGEVIRGDATTIVPKSKLVKETVQIRDAKKEKIEDEDEEGEAADPEMDGYGEETYDYFARNVAKLGKNAYEHYVSKITQFLEHDQQYYAVRLFTFMQQSMAITPGLYETMIKSYLDKGNFTSAFFYLDQMHKSELKPTEATVESFFTFFTKHPSKSNQAKFETLLSSISPSSPTHPTTANVRRRRGG